MHANLFPILHSQKCSAVCVLWTEKAATDLCVLAAQSENELNDRQPTQNLTGMCCGRSVSCVRAPRATSLAQSGFVNTNMLSQDVSRSHFPFSRLKHDQYNGPLPSANFPFFLISHWLQAGG